MTYNIRFCTAVLKPITPNPSCDAYQWIFRIYAIRKHLTKQDISLRYTLKDLFALFSAMHSNPIAPAYALLGQLNLLICRLECIFTDYFTILSISFDYVASNGGLVHNIWQRIWEQLWPYQGIILAVAWRN